MMRDGLANRAGEDGRGRWDLLRTRVSGLLPQDRGIAGESHFRADVEYRAQKIYLSRSRMSGHWPLRVASGRRWCV